MARHIRLTEPTSGLDCRIMLFDEAAPRTAEAFWLLAGGSGSHEAIHAMWTGPELSCPVPTSRFPASAALDQLTLENATSFPGAGDIAIAYAPKNAWKGQPDFGFFDVGLFYGPGARLLLPMGWIMASVCGQIVPEDFDSYRAGCAAIRRSGACHLTFAQIA